MAARKFDLIVFGATGFTGGLVARYIASRLAQGPTRTCADPASFKWAIAGRSQAKLESLRGELSAENVEVVVADSSDEGSLDAMTSSTTTVVSTVGPFTLYGEPLVASCVRSGTHYVDSTGETPWVRKMIDKYHDTAKEKNIRIVPMCGFDSIPADLGTHMMLRHLSQKGSEAAYVRAAVSMKGGGSGGTLYSIMTLLSDPESVKAMSKPFLLNPDRLPAGNTTSISSDQMFMRYDNDHQKWTYPFIMAGANTRVVRRSHAVHSEHGVPLASSDFEYNEASAASNAIVAFIASVLLGFAVVVLNFSLGRNLVARFGPKPGQGPSKETREKAWFRYRLAAMPVGGSSPVIGEVAGRDPGYDETAKMLAECAICLSLDQDQLEGNPAGVITPATAMGDVVIERLREAGMTFKVEDE